MGSGRRHRANLRKLYLKKLLTATVRNGGIGINGRYSQHLEQREHYDRLQWKRDVAKFYSKNISQKKSAEDTLVPALWGKREKKTRVLPNRK